MLHSSRALPALLAFASAACSAAGTDLSKLGETRRTATTAEEFPSDSGRARVREASGASESGGSPVIGEGVVVQSEGTTEPTLPVDVAGSFLVLCSADTQVSYVATPTVTDDTVGCVVTREDGTAVTLVNPQIRIRSRAGVMVEAAGVTKETSAPWGFGFTFPPDAFSEAVVSFELGGRTETLTTNVFSFNWVDSPLFQAFLKGQRESMALPSPIVMDPPPNESGETDEAAPTVSVFATAAEFDGSMTIASADVECATRGARTSKTATRWIAALTTTVTPLADRFPSLDLGPVANLKREIIADSLASFFQEPLRKPVIFDDRGLPVTAPLNAGPYDVTPPRYNVAVWAPLDPACDDWTSAAAPSLAIVADVMKAEAWSKAGRRSCARKARILCIGYR